MAVKQIDRRQGQARRQHRQEIDGEDAREVIIELFRSSSVSPMSSSSVSSRPTRVQIRTTRQLSWHWGALGVVTHVGLFCYPCGRLRRHAVKNRNGRSVVSSPGSPRDERRRFRSRAKAQTRLKVPPPLKVLPPLKVPPLSPGLCQPCLRVPRSLSTESSDELARFRSATVLGAFFTVWRGSRRGASRSERGDGRVLDKCLLRSRALPSRIPSHPSRCLFQEKRRFVPGRGGFVHRGRIFY